MTAKVFNPEAQKQIGAYWSQRALQPQRTWNWWTCKPVIQHLNRLVCGQELPGVSQGLCQKAKQQVNHTLKLGISVGCGIGVKEMHLIQWGLVDRMICFELSAERIAQANAEAKRRSLSDRIEFHQTDVFCRTDLNDRFDLVHWNNSLHHMPDTFAALRWSRSVLKPGGLLMMDDYVGPNYIQFSDQCLQFANQIRAKIPRKYFIHPASSPETPRFIGSECQRPDRAKIIAKDPSEAVDAENILPAMRAIFPNAEILHTGGAIYFAALPPLYANFNLEDEGDRSYLQALLTIDELYTEAHPEQTLYATALAFKN